MLCNTFCHIPGIGLQSEQRIWASGIHGWKDLLENTSARPPFSRNRMRSLQKHVEQSFEELEQGRLHYFAELLPGAHHWRLFAQFRHSIAYLDIETTGMGDFNDHITTIALYDGKSIFHFVNGENLGEFHDRITNYELLVTYNGKCFDLPFIRKSLGIPMDQAHIDLRYVLAGLGYRGGLKGCEKQLGIDRAELDGVDGFFAVLLWRDYLRNNNQRALETLLAYNIEDVVNLERLMILAYNLKLQDTPFTASHKLAPPEPAQVPFQADTEVIERIRREYHYLIPPFAAGAICFPQIR